MRTFIIGIGLWGYGGWEVTQSAFCKLEKQDSEWYNSQSGSEGPRTTSPCVWGQEKVDVPSGAKRADLPSLHLLFYSGSQRIGGCHCHWGGQYSSLSQPIQTLVSSRNTETQTQKYCLPVIWASLNPDKLTHKINHHTKKLLIWLHLYSFAILRMLYKLNHTLWYPGWCMCWKFILSDCWAASCWMYQSSFDNLPTEGHLDCSQFGAILNKTATNICVWVIFFIVAK